MKNKHHSNITAEMIEAAEEHYKQVKVKFTNGKKLARAIGCSTWQAGYILRALGMKRWSDSKHTCAKTPFVVPWRLRK